MNKFNYICAISGVATSGKDTLFTTLQKILLQYGIDFRRAALADILKAEINDFCLKHYGISAFTKNPKEKEIVRLLMLSHGKAKRILTNGTYWTNLVESQIEESKSNGELLCLTDLRYANPEYPNDELTWLKQKHNGILIHVERILPNGQVLKSNIEDEIKFDPIIKKNADYHIKWATSTDENTLFDTVNIQLEPLIKIIQNEKTN
jgi:hypothetical protein